MKPGHSFTIEPMICEGNFVAQILRGSDLVYRHSMEQFWLDIALDRGVKRKATGRIWPTERLYLALRVPSCWAVKR